MGKLDPLRALTDYLSRELKKSELIRIIEIIHADFNRAADWNTARASAISESRLQVDHEQ